MTDKAILDRIEVIQGDISKFKADVIVNAANNSLLGGGGVDGAIHRAAGPELLEECRKLKGCKTGEAKITKAYKLPAKYIIHTAGPVWKKGKHQEPELLRDCYINSLKLAGDRGAETIAFPAISTGAYKFPIELASEIAVRTAIEYLKTDPRMKKITFVCFSGFDLEVYQGRVKELTAPA